MKKQVSKLELSKVTVSALNANVSNLGVKGGATTEVATHGKECYPQTILDFCAPESF